jgi:hypothetical protein
VTYDWLLVAVQKVWEGFFYTIGVGIAAALVVSLIVAVLQKWIERFLNTKTGRMMSKLWVGLHGNYGRERITSGKKKTV